MASWRKQRRLKDNPDFAITMHMDADSIVEMELLASEFWPPVHRTTLSNGWVLGDNEGVTWRANCVFPYGALSDEIILQVEHEYGSMGLPSAFKITQAAPPHLDDVLEKRGYEKHMVTHVQTRPLRRDDSAGLHTDLSISLGYAPSDNWLNKQAVDERYRGRGLKVLQGILGRIPGEKAFVDVSTGSGVIGVGLGVVHKKWLGLFSIRVDQESRRRGIGGAISDVLLDWGLQKGAEHAFLQVEDDNRPAIELYRKRGFQTAYTYWYRIRAKP